MGLNEYLGIGHWALGIGHWRIRFAGSEAIAFPLGNSNPKAMTLRVAR